jgi:hypothetical protein
MTDAAATERLRSIVDDPPRVHPTAPSGVWGTDPACYDLLIERLAPGMHTLETGCGVSTALFAAAGAHHTAVFYGPPEGERILAYCRDRGIATDRLTLIPGPSDVVLPTLDGGPLDVVFVDGSHGFPFPHLDWYYGGSRLRAGGVFVLDDVQLPAPAQVADFLDADPRWQPIERTRKWAAYRREGDGPLREDWKTQRFLARPVPLTERARREVRRAGGRVKRRLGMRTRSS